MHRNWFRVAKALVLWQATEPVNQVAMLKFKAPSLEREKLAMLQELWARHSYQAALKITEGEKNFEKQKLALKIQHFHLSTVQPGWIIHLYVTSSKASDFFFTTQWGSSFCVSKLSRVRGQSSARFQFRIEKKYAQDQNSEKELRMRVRLYRNWLTSTQKKQKLYENRSV